MDIITPLNHPVRKGLGLSIQEMHVLYDVMRFSPCDKKASFFADRYDISIEGIKQIFISLKEKGYLVRQGEFIVPSNEIIEINRSENVGVYVEANGVKIVHKPQVSDTPPIAPKKPLKIVFSQEYMDFVTFYNKVMERQSKGEEKSFKNFNKLLAQGYKKHEFELVLFKAKSDPHHIQNKFHYLTLEFITRQDIFDRYYAKKTESKSINPID